MVIGPLASSHSYLPNVSGLPKVSFVQNMSFLLTHLHSRVTVDGSSASLVLLKIICEKKRKFTNYLKESCCLASD